jgi:hypothetical protein
MVFVQVNGAGTFTVFQVVVSVLLRRVSSFLGKSGRKLTRGRRQVSCFRISHHYCVQRKVRWRYRREQKDRRSRGLAALPANRSTKRSRSRQGVEFRIEQKAFWKARFFLQFCTTKDFLPTQCSLNDKPARTAFFLLFCVPSLLYLLI